MLVPLLAVLVSIAQPGRPASSEPPSLERFFKIRTPTSPRLAQDGTLYVADWPDGVTQLYRLNAGGGQAGPGAPLEKLTSFGDGMSGYALSPDGSRIIISAGVGGNEQTQLYLLEGAAEAGTEPKSLTANPDAVHGFELWARDGSGFVYTANDAVPSDFHIYRYDLATGASTKLLAREGSWGAADITDDGKRVLVGRYFSASHADAFELDASTGEVREIVVSEGDVLTFPIAYLPGEDRVLVSTDAFTGTRTLAVVTLSTGAVERVVRDVERFDIEDVSVNDERTLLAFTYNEDGYATPRVCELPSFREIPLPKMERGIAGIQDIRGRTLVWTMSNARTPNLAYAWEVGTRALPRAITRADDQGIDFSTFMLPTLVRIASFDALEIPSFMYLPPGYQPGTPLPFVVNFHGGPEGQHRPGFNRSTQYLLSRGFGVLEPNVRGSTGYGRDFHRLDDYTKRWDSVRDGVEAARWLVANGYSKPGMIAASGGSYGGFMSVATVIEGSDVFGAGIDVVGIVNFRTFLEQTKDYRRALREAEYGPLSDPEFLDSVSPIHRAEEIRCPMMIVHGLNDPRVPVGEAMQLAVALQKRGLEPEVLFFPDEGHGIAKLDNRLLFGERMAAFLEANLKGR